MIDRPLGATPRADGTASFLVWAPRAERVEVELVAPRRAVIELERLERGYHGTVLEGVQPGARYLLRLDGAKGVPDPASRAQPDGVHGASVVVDPRFEWSAGDWVGPSMEELVVYELHVGTFTSEGTFDAVVERLAGLRELGVTAIELMPIARFPGGRNWGYDGVLPFAIQDTYGGIRGLQRLVDACHRYGLGVLVDVVYNHLGPEGNRLAMFGPYFTETYHTPWGAGLNFDGAHCDEVRRYFIEHATFLIEQCGVDGLRLDATHAIHDQSATPFLEELTRAVHERAIGLGRQALVIAESDQNDPRYVRSHEVGGLGMDGVWCDDLHHTLHVALTGETDGYYGDFDDLEMLCRAWSQGMGFQGQWSRVRDRRHGRSVAGAEPWCFVVCTQNHDQVGNRMLGERLGALVESQDMLALAAAVVLTSVATPLLFMGEEHGETAPFLYFTSHGDQELADAVRTGRRAEFAAFPWQGDPPDPQAEATFLRSKLSPPGPDGERLRCRYRELIAMRRELPRGPARAEIVAERVVRGWRGAADGAVQALFHLGAEPVHVELGDGKRWRRRWDSLGERSQVPDEVTFRIELLPWQAVVLVPAWPSATVTISTRSVW